MKRKETIDYFDVTGELLRARRPEMQSPCRSYHLGRVLHMHFRTGGCRYGRCLMCDYCHSSKPLAEQEILDAFESYYEPHRAEAEVLLLGSLGSILDGREFPPSLFEAVLGCARRTDAQIVVFETSWETVDAHSAADIVRALEGKEVYFECGLESSSEHVRRICFGKEIEDEEVAAAVRIAHDAGAKVIANLMLGAPFMSREERIVDARRSVMEAFAVGIDEVAVFPLNVKPYTAVRRLYDSGQFELVSCADLVRLLASLDPETLDKVSLAWWGNRKGEYSIPDIPPEPDAGKIDLPDTFSAYMQKSSARDREIIVKRALSLLPESERIDWDSSTPSEEELLARRAKAAAYAERFPFGRHLAWIGPRESDIDRTGELFKASSTVFGTDEGGNRSYCARIGRRTNHDDVTRDQIDTMTHDQAALTKYDPSTRFIAYNSFYAFVDDRCVLEREVCLNEKALLGLFCDKTRFREFASAHVPVPDSVAVDAAACDAQRLRRAFPQWKSFVVQRGISSGGYETYLIESGAEIPDHLLRLGEKLLVSEYIEPNVPVNIHFVVFDDCCLMFPASVQMIVKKGSKLLYGGCDYVCYRDLPENVRRSLESHARTLAEAVRRSGYRGVLGFDAVVRGEDVFFLEMNARFQASTHALNAALQDAHLPSVHDFHIESFSCASPRVFPKNLEHLRVDYSSVAYGSSGSLRGDALVEHVRTQAASCPKTMLFKDGAAYPDRERGAYLFSVIYPSRISSLNAPDEVAIDQNVVPDGDQRFDAASVRERFMDVKIALLNQGMRIASSAFDCASEHGGFRAGVNDSIDIVLSERVVNVPVSGPYVELSPFELRKGKNGLALFWLDSFLSDVQYYYRVGLENEATSSGVRIGSMCFLAADRVRIQHHDRCDFACSGKGCAFCNFPHAPSGFKLDDVLEAIDRYLGSGIEFRHFLIGGGTDTSRSSWETVARIADHIRTSGCDKPIYYMDIPPASTTHLATLKDAGVTEVGFNIEVFDRYRARKLMPAKGRIPLKTYFDALERSVELWGASGEVRSALIVGLESAESTLCGVEELAKRGVSPILSAFRPTLHSRLEGAVAPRNSFLSDVYDRAVAVCERFGVSLGPSCPQCRNNVLAE